MNPIVCRCWMRVGLEKISAAMAARFILEIFGNGAQTKGTVAEYGGLLSTGVKGALVVDESGSPDVAVVLERLAAARLLTLDADWVDVAHEALIRCWPRLRGWLAADREGLRLAYDDPPSA